MHSDDHFQQLNAYIDGELMPEETMAIREHLASCGDCAAEYETLRALSERVRGGVERPRAPAALRAKIHEALLAADTADAEPRELRPHRLPWMKLIAAGLLVAAVSGGASFALGRRAVGTPAAGEAVLASHIRSLMPGHLTDVASNDTHNVKPWFNGRLDLSPSVPRLDSLGFPLVGGRLDYVDGRTVAAVVYTRRQHVINVFSWPVSDAGATDRMVRNEKGYHLVEWRRDGAEFWVVSDVSVADLEQFIELFTRSDAAPRER